MPKKLKPYKVDTIQTRKGTVDMFLDREDQIFFGMVGPTRIQDKVAKECRVKLHKAMSEWGGLVWKQYIYLEAHGGGHPHSHYEFTATNTDLGILFYRFEGAKTLDGKWVRRKFKEDTPGGQKYYDPEKMDSWFGGPDGDCDRDNLIPYSKEAWDVLNKIVKAINTAGDQLQALANAKNLPKLIAGEFNLLPAPKTSKKRKR